MKTLQVLRYSIINGFQDAAAMFTPKTYLTGWLLRVLSQVTFFALIGSLLGSEETTHFLLVGNVVAVGAMVVHSVSASTVWERWAGTLPLLFAAPSRPLIVLMGRSFNWVPDAMFSATGALLIVGPIFGLPMPWPEVLWVLPLLLATIIATYGFGLFLGSMSIRAPESRNFISRVATTVTMAICGVNVPVDFFPGAVQAVAYSLPVTHGLLAIRSVLDVSSASVVLAHLSAALLTGAGWYAVAIISFSLFEARSRTTGSLEFG
ncbi:MAG TPA: ABC transporter permease [Actinomycetota bacterium]|nr:ABC transporter permease [Actinomycetota bacterium]